MWWKKDFSGVWVEAVDAVCDGKIRALCKLIAKYPALLEGENGTQLLLSAASNGQLEAMQLLVDEYGIDVNVCLRERGTPLINAAGCGEPTAVRWLLDRGADIEGRYTPERPTPLLEAIMGGNPQGGLEVVKLLVERGADTNALYRQANDPPMNSLRAAKRWRRHDIAAFLESRGVKENLLDQSDTAASETQGDIGSIVKWFEATWWPTYEKGENVGLSALGEKERVLFLVGYLIDQLESVGASGMYANPSGAYAREMADALQTIQADEAASLLRQINACFPGGSPAKNDRRRWQQLEKLPKQAAQHCTQLEQLLDETVDVDGEEIAMLLKQLHDYCTS